MRSVYCTLVNSLYILLFCIFLFYLCIFYCKLTKNWCDPLGKEKRRSKCSGCHILHEDHTFGTPGPACQGPPKSPEVKLNLDIDDESQPWEYENTKAYLANGAKPKDECKAVKWEVHEASEPFQVTKPNSELDEVASLMARLTHLEMEEKELQHVTQVVELRKRLAAKEHSLAKLREKLLDSSEIPPNTNQHNVHANGKCDHWSGEEIHPHGPTSTMNIKGLRQLEKAGKLTIPQAPLDNLLVGNDSSRHDQNKYGSDEGSRMWRDELTMGHQEPSLQQLFEGKTDKESEMFLRPGNLRSGETYLKIVDYIDRLVPVEDERTISQSGQCKFIVSYGTKKQKLEDISLAQWVIGNTRIMYTLLFSNKLPTNKDVRNYFSYTVKIMELANKYDWKSVLRYDDEYRHLQSI